MYLAEEPLFYKQYFLEYVYQGAKFYLLAVSDFFNTLFIENGPNQCCKSELWHSFNTNNVEQERISKKKKTYSPFFFLPAMAILLFLIDAFPFILKVHEIAQVNKLFQLLNLIFVHCDAFYVFIRKRLS